MIRLRMLPGDDGDCILLEYGDGAHIKRMLIDGGRADTYPLIKPTLAKCGGKIDILVVTHIDQDHILGVVELLEDLQRPVQFGDVWFNGYGHLLDVEDFGPKDGERLTSALVKQNIPWNTAFDGRSVEVGRTVDLGDGSTLTILSPDRAQLAALQPVWGVVIAENGLVPLTPPVAVLGGLESFGPLDVDALADTKFAADSSKTNRSSIGFLFEFDGKRVVFTGDADDSRITKSLRACANGGKLHVDALKVAHHGSHRNLSRELLESIECNRYLISTSGAVHKHPNDVTMARILKYGGGRKEIVFNYRDRATRWDVDDMMAEYNYTVTVPPPDQDGVVEVVL